VIYGLREHLARLRRSATALYFAHIPGDDEIIAAITATLHANRMAGVTVIDGRAVGAGGVGPVTTRIAELYQEHAAANGIRLPLEPPGG
jgi:branched-subunit amino acid aminotransferase/4-amino-4-deoxychorismate lyase